MPQNLNTPTDGRIYLRLLSYTWSHWSVFLVAVFGMIVYAATEPMFAALMKPMLDESFLQRDPESLRVVPLMIMGLFILRGIAGFLSSYGMNWIGRTIVYQLRGQMFNHMLRLPTEYYDRNASGQLLSKMTYNVEQVANATTTAITIVIRDTLTAIALLGYMFYMSGMLALVFLIFGPMIALIINYISKRFRRISSRIQGAVGDITQVVQEGIEGSRVVKTFGGQDVESRSFDEVNQRNRTQQLKMAMTSAISVPFIQFLAASVLAGVIFLASSSSNIQSPGEFVSFITAMLLLLPPLKRLTTVSAAVQRGVAAGDSIFELLDTDQEKDLGNKTLARAKGDITYENVCFTYEKEKGRVLSDVSFSIKPGQTIAFVGRSGSGKSTLVNLLPRFYQPEQGVIRLDGIPIDDYKLSELRDQIAVVTQHVTLFNDTIARNIAYGKMEHASTEQIKQAVEAAHAMEFIDELPDGLDTRVGDKGVMLSGGQRQRIAIARALLKNAPILILDEATSALDTESEKHVQAGLEKLMQNRTTLVIAHRLSTIENADHIVVLADGRVVESGSHTELLKKNGRYKALHQVQFHE